MLLFITYCLIKIIIIGIVFKFRFYIWKYWHGTLQLRASHYLARVRPAPLGHFNFNLQQSIFTYLPLINFNSFLRVIKCFLEKFLNGLSLITDHSYVDPCENFSSKSRITTLTNMAVINLVLKLLSSISS